MSKSKVPSLQIMLQRFYEYRANLANHRIKNYNYVGEYVFCKIFGGDWRGGPTKAIDIEGSSVGRIQVKQRRLPEDGRDETRAHCRDVVRGTYDQLGLVVFKPDWGVDVAVLVPHDPAADFIDASSFSEKKIPIRLFATVPGSTDCTSRAQAIVARAPEV